MFKETLEYLLTPTTPLAKRYGFLQQSIALRHRYERCKSQWLPHLKNCQDIFTEVVKTLPKTDHVVILGSAHLHEIPLHLLAENFKEITLVDVIHPLLHHRLAKKNPHLHTVTLDITGILHELDNIKSFEALLKMAEHQQEERPFYFDADLIISGNLLSQLALLPIDTIERRIKRRLSLKEKDHVCTLFAEAHIKTLSACKGKKLIYSDREVTYRSPTNDLVYQGSYPVHFDGYRPLKAWQWTLAPLGEASKDYSLEMKIEAFTRD